MKWYGMLHKYICYNVEETYHTWIICQLSVFHEKEKKKETYEEDEG